MNRRLLVELPGPVVGAQRVRATRTGTHLRMYSAPAHVAAEGRIVVATREVWSGAPLDEPCFLFIHIWSARPQRLMRKRDRSGLPVPATGKPDLDNVAKLVMDALTRAGVWVDDTRVCRLEVERWYSPLDLDGNLVQAPRMIVQVWTL